MKIPKQAKKVFTGDIFDVYQWPQKMYDGSSKTFEMIKRVDTVQVIATAKDKILVAYQKQPSHKKFFYSLFGGRIDGKETPLHAAKRELLEEAGLFSSDWQLLEKRYPYNKMEWIVYTYIAKNCQSIGKQNLDAGEKIKIKQVTLDQFIDLAFLDDVRGFNIVYELVKKIYKGQKEQVEKLLFKK